MKIVIAMSLNTFFKLPSSNVLVRSQQTFSVKGQILTLFCQYGCGWQFCRSRSDQPMDSTSSPVTRLPPPRMPHPWPQKGWGSGLELCCLPALHSYLTAPIKTSICPMSYSFLTPIQISENAKLWYKQPIGLCVCVYVKEHICIKDVWNPTFSSSALN